MRVKLVNVKRVFKDKVILDIDGLELKKGKIYAVLGPNGAGKTTMLRIMAGIDKATSGNVYYDGADRNGKSAVAYMPQHSYLFDMTVLDNVILGIKNSGIGGGEARSRAQSALECVGMREFYHVKTRSLSGGEAQRVALARTLALGKSLVLLDEPASATDIAGVELVEKYIKITHEKDRSTIVFTTHNPSQAARIADEVLMMHGGRVVEKNTPSNMFNSPKRQETMDFLKSWRL